MRTKVLLIVLAVLLGAVIKTGFNDIERVKSPVSTHNFGATVYQIDSMQPERETYASLKWENSKNTKSFVSGTVLKAIWVDNVAILRKADAEIGDVYATKGYYKANDRGQGFYTIRVRDSNFDVDDGGSVIFLDNGNVAELITDGTVNVKQFGAYGDDVHDDTSAIQKAINTGNIVYIPQTGSRYLTSGTIQLSNNKIVNEGIIKYTGFGYALSLAPIDNINCLTVDLGTVITATGGCLELDTTNAWMQYVNIYFKKFAASSTGNCVYAKIVADSWANEIRLINGRFARGKNGVFLDRTTATTPTSNWFFVRCGFEGIKNGVNIPEGAAGWVFNCCRAYESLSTVVYSRALSWKNYQKIVWIGTRGVGKYFVDSNFYEILFLSGYSQINSSIIGFRPIVLYNKMVYGIEYNQGRRHLISSYDNASTYNPITQKQTIDFDIVYSYLQSTTGTAKIELPITRTFSIPASSYDDDATSVDILMPESMFVVANYDATNSFLLNIEIKPGVTVTLYGKEGSHILYSKTNSTGSNITKNVKLSHVDHIYVAEELTGKIVTY